MKFIIFFNIFSFLTISNYSQDFLINFNGIGESVTVDSVLIENITQGTSKTIEGTDILNLKPDITISNLILKNSENVLRIYPNPSNDFVNIEFLGNESNYASILLFNQIGEIILKNKLKIVKGLNTFQISGLNKGIYFINIIYGKFSYSGKIVSFQKINNPICSIILRTCDIKFNENRTKSSNSTIQMKYNLSDRLLFTGFSKNYKVIITDIPTGSKTITFNFISCSDFEENHYSIVKIGTQIWMAENLKSTKYNDGEIIPEIIDNEIWNSISTPGFCWYSNNQINYKDKYGALYNWFAVNNEKLCPIGWHIPTDIEWTNLEFYLMDNGYNYDGTLVGNKITKALASTKEWFIDTNTGTTGNVDYPKKRNASGFTALPGGHRTSFFNFDNLFSHAFFWSSTETDQNKALSRAILYNYCDFGSGSNPKNNGYSIRCLKN